MGHYEESGFVPLNIAVLTVSDTRTEETDKSGRILTESAEQSGHKVVEKAIVKDDIYQMRAVFSRWIADPQVHVILSTGGTGITGRDSTPHLPPMWRSPSPNSESWIWTSRYLDLTPTSYTAKTVMSNGSKQCDQGARCDVPLEAGRSAQIRLATFGPIRYLMVVQGEQALLESQEVAITDLLKGFKLLDSKKAPAAICQLAMQAHTGGGKIAGNTYSHPLHNLKVTAPEGWSGSAFASRHLFRVRFQCPAGTSNLLLQAMAPPVGYTTWTEERANQLFLRSCANQQLETTTDTSWTRDPQGFRWREARSRDDQTPAILRLARRGPVLVMMTAEARDQATLAEIRKAIGSLALVK